MAFAGGEIQKQKAEARSDQITIRLDQFFSDIVDPGLPNYWTRFHLNGFFYGLDSDQSYVKPCLLTVLYLN